MQDGRALDVHEQKAACQSHRVIPILLKNWAEPIDASAQDNWVKYRLNDGGFEFVNGQPPGATPARNFTRWNTNQ